MTKDEENIKPISFMGYNLNELGEVEGAIPVLKHFTDELHDRIIQEQEGYVYRQCLQLDIDPNVLKKQLIEIKRLNAIIREKDEQIEKMKLDQKTAFDKGMKHLAKELKEYDRINGAWTDHFEHTVNKVLKWELERKGRTEWEFGE